MNHPAKTGFGRQRGEARRRWARHCDTRTVLVESDGTERLGKTVDFSEGGVGVLLRGRGVRIGDAVKVAVVFGTTVVLFRGRAVRTDSVGEWERVGVQLTHSGRNPLAGRGRSSPRVGSRLRTGVGPTQGLPTCTPSEINLGDRFPLLSDSDAEQMREESIAIARLLRGSGIRDLDHWEEALWSFLRRYPESPHRNGVTRQLFRLGMDRRYPAFPGITIRGRVRCVHPGGGDTSTGLPIVLLDRYAVCRSDREGFFVARGIPAPLCPVVLTLAVRSSCLSTQQEVAVAMGTGEPAEFSVEIPVTRNASDVDGLQQLVAALDRS